MVCGILDRDREMSTYPVYVSKAFAEKVRRSGISLYSPDQDADAGEMQMSELPEW